MADEAKNEDVEAEKSAAEAESEEVRAANAEAVKKAAKGKPSRIELREKDIHPSGLNPEWDGPTAKHDARLNMIDLTPEEQAERRNLR